ncbi:MAG: pacearchaeosortase [Candidatus Pacearchaeota archaeon]
MKYLFFLRYIILIIFGIFIDIFYIFTFPTIFLLKFSLSKFFSLTFINNYIIGPKIIEIIPACIGGSAYYLLLILNLSTPMKFKKRILSLFFLFFLFFIFNFSRLFLLIFLEFNGINTNFYHKFFWYFGSTVFVFLIWILNIKLFKIEEIPVVSDVKYIIYLTKKRS